MQRLFKFVLLCGVDRRNRILDGEWMGYVKYDQLLFPFLLRTGSPAELLYGGEDNYYEQTNLLEKAIEPTTLFTVRNAPGSAEKYESTWEITAVYPYDA